MPSASRPWPPPLSSRTTRDRAIPVVIALTRMVFVSTAAVESFQRDGFVVIPGLLSDAEVLSLSG